MKKSRRTITPAGPETIDQTAALVTERGGKGIAVVADHNDSTQVKNLVQKIRTEQRGKLHILVNDISELVHADFGKLFWQLNLEDGLKNLRNVVQTHVTTSHFAAPLLIETAAGEKPAGLIVEIGDGDSYSYRGHLFYDLTKTTVIRLAFAMARELPQEKRRRRCTHPPVFSVPKRCSSTSASPRKTGATPRKRTPTISRSETPASSAGRAVAALAWPTQTWLRNPDASGVPGVSRTNILSPTKTAARPIGGCHFASTYGNPLKYCDDAFYSNWIDPAVDALFPD